MPNHDGYHDRPLIHRTTGEPWVWHYCKGADRDELVRDTPQARKEHLRACTKRQKHEAKKQAKQTERKRLEALALARRMRRIAA